jgi:hypothetical protein
MTLKQIKIKYWKLKEWKAHHLYSFSRDNISGEIYLFYRPWRKIFCKHTFEHYASSKNKMSFPYTVSYNNLMK